MQTPAIYRSHALDAGQRYQALFKFPFGKQFFVGQHSESNPQVAKIEIVVSVFTNSRILGERGGTNKIAKP
jgi:hypothetical protein